jgi:peptidoglycan hydrolase CwlO-like protein
MDTFLYAGLSASVLIIIAFCAFTMHYIGRYKAELPKLKMFEKIEALEEQRNEVESQLEDLREKKYQAEAIIEEADRRRDEMAKNEDDFQRLQDDLKNLQQESEKLESLRSEADQLSSTIADLENKKNEHDSLINQLQSQAKALEEDISELKELRSEVQQLEAALPSLRNDKEQIEASIGELRKTKSDLEDELGEIQAKIDQGRGSVAELEGKIEALKAELDRLTSELENQRENLASEKKEHIQQLERQSQGVLEEIERRKDHLATLKTDILAAGGVDEDSDKLKDLWSPVFHSDEDLDTESSEEDRLGLLQKSLREAKVRIASRTVLSFHTALKTQNISPLTVLAGISGTGKSLLPKLYSDCMGIKFLNMAVQPGWNSPQDMFGFYNYIEQKYKGTTLARAMVQFDRHLPPHFWEKNEEFQHMDDQVLLVLLDEMNLARIEYYFSELLSRLELRRLIDEDEDEKRSEVAIPLEVGHASGIAEKLELYPGRNVLFAGTMNEDESTQSLSDKVLDRACVLRFGKPDTYVMNQIDTSDFSGQPLSFELWGNWLAKDISADRGLEDFVKEMGEVLHKVGSPFGHRVSQGIVEYVCQYPGANKNDAMADQVEQKILPKLRGKDMNAVGEALDQLEGAVDRLDDDLLLSAIREGRQAGTGTFIWRGLDRATSDLTV